MNNLTKRFQRMKNDQRVFLLPSITELPLPLYERELFSRNNGENIQSISSPSEKKEQDPQQPLVSKGLWSQQEDELLIKAVSVYPENGELKNNSLYIITPILHKPHL